MLSRILCGSTSCIWGPEQRGQESGGELRADPGSNQRYINDAKGSRISRCCQAPFPSPPRRQLPAARGHLLGKLLLHCTIHLTQGHPGPQLQEPGGCTFSCQPGEAGGAGWIRAQGRGPRGHVQGTTPSLGEREKQPGRPVRKVGPRPTPY